MKKLLIATTNPGKLAEIKRFLGDLPVKLVSLSDVGILDIVEETGKTFEENAILKAKYYCQKSGLPTLADDGGFEIDALGGQPGVKSHRWIHGDREDTDEELIAYTLEKLKGLPQAERGAQLRLVLALVFPDGRQYTVEEKTRGVVAEKPSEHRTIGFPYRSLLFLPEINKYYDHDLLTPEETEQFNHRKRALDRLKPLLKQSLTRTDSI
ncbi:MAG: non-canonical purine NTP pyrophosphatase [Candidatus Gottesmanbacteria bacterium]|nr:non-canonical purine NTP pyrophosphatase [Candidatus Gottesmanbacteria bacterium]